MLSIVLEEGNPMARDMVMTVASVEKREDGRTIVTLTGDNYDIISVVFVAEPLAEYTVGEQVSVVTSPLLDVGNPPPQPQNQ